MLSIAPLELCSDCQILLPYLTSSQKQTYNPFFLQLDSYYTSKKYMHPAIHWFLKTNM